MKLNRILAFFVITFALTAMAPGETAIVATVGDDAITTQDLVNRTRLVIISSGLKGDEETARKIAPQVLQNLINEKLQMQEASRLKMEASDDEIKKAIEGIEKQNKMEVGQLSDIMKHAGIPPVTLQQQIKAQLLWSKIRAKKIQPKINVSDDEINDYLKSQSLNPAEEEYFVNEIVLPVENPKDENKMKDLATKLTGELQSGKAKFPAIAKQFSQSGSAQNGGEVGWLAENQVPKEILSEVKRVGSNKIIGPIRSVEGYFIIFISDTRTIDAHADQNVVTVRQFEIPVKNPPAVKAALPKLKNINDPAQACSNGEAYAKTKGANVKNYNSVMVKNLDPAVMKVIEHLPTGQFSDPEFTGTSVAVFLVCEKTQEMTPQMTADEREKAQDALFKRKMELESRKYLRDMRRNTNIEIKI